MAGKTFEGRLGQFADLAIEDIMAVVKQSVQDVMSDAQQPKARGGRMPVDTGYLRNSLVSALNGTTSITGPASYGLVIARMEAGDIFESGWLAEYAMRIEFGFKGTDAKGRRYNQAPAFFLRGAAQKWPRFVRANAMRFKRT